MSVLVTCQDHFRSFRKIVTPRSLLDCNIRLSQMLCCILVVPALVIQRQEDYHKFKASLVITTTKKSKEKGRQRKGKK